MNITDLKFRQRVFDLMNGNLDLQRFPVPESKYVANEFADGSICSESYGEILNAYSRLCARLQQEQWNDPDIEIIINCYNSITEHLCLASFGYGVLFARMEHSKECHCLSGDPQL